MNVVYVWYVWMEIMDEIDGMVTIILANHLCM